MTAEGEHLLALPFTEDEIRHLARMELDDDHRAVIRLGWDQQCVLVDLCRNWVEKNPPPVKIEVEFTPAEVAAMRQAWVRGGTMPIGKARSKILDALPPEG